MNFLAESHGYWYQIQRLSNKSFKCGYCGDKVSSDKGYAIYNKRTTTHNGSSGGIYICSNCNGATFFTIKGEQLPGEMFGNKLSNIPDDLGTLYEEARKCFSHNCNTAVVMLCRKMLMNIAVSEGAPANKSFFDYVNYLTDKNYTPPNSKDWVDHIRKKGNEANHEIESMNQQEARNLLVFIEMILRFVYEFPSMISE